MSNLKFEFTMPQGFENQIKSVVIQATEQAIQEYYERQATKEWMSIAEARNYLGISHNTLSKFRNMGLPICEVNGVKRISRQDIDVFMKKHSY